ncbi:hypothetical protein SLS62_001035 [Diatrype stigma]|uniref:Uncharacterized protein n=1 Tax=Diatrype stigma TaxID=117547 RepID=A0AAN9V9I8_9PEZI
MSDGIEYEGLADDRSIHAGSDRCFRDYSPGDTVLSLSDDGRAIYTRPMPSFPSPTGEEDYPEDVITVATPSKTTDYEAVSPNHDGGALFPATGSRRSSSGSSNSSSRTPMGRFRRDEQPHEKLALQLSATTAATDAAAPCSTTPPPPRRYGPDPSTLLPGEGTDIMAPALLPQNGLEDVEMDLNAPPAPPPHHRPRHPHHWQRRGQRPAGDIPLPASAPRLPRSVLGPPSSSATARTPAEELHEKTRFMKSTEWEMLASEEQAKYIHEVRRVRAVELPRESKTVRVRKRNRARGGEGAKTDESQSGPSSRS